ncbi:hypothetical protein [Paracoccus ravus]|uniref:hypothetical protein n=1 Tax=Paracoccus ravus TaxID=2447760 RepID=UPI00106E34DA|nr:hypothetical protein [Paracoccus ravus]
MIRRWPHAIYVPVGALLLCWPVLVTQDIFIFEDTTSYLKGGAVIPGMLQEKLAGLSLPGLSLPGLSLPGPDQPGMAAIAQSQDGPAVVRSFVYSLVSYLVVSAGGPLVLSLLQAALVVLMSLFVVEPDLRARPVLMGLGAGILALTSPVAIYTSLLMPDILAALILLHAIVVAVHFDRLGPWPRRCSTLLACFAVAAHYGNPPLALALFGATAIFLGFRRALSGAKLLALLLPVLFSPVANLAASNVALETTSVSPLRLPILLARSIGDGPGLWYLQEACPEADLAFCRLFKDHVPESMHELLWSETGINRLTEQEMQQIREEEFKILFLVFRAYPMAQFNAIFGNALRQIGMVGTTDIDAADHLSADFEPVTAGSEAGARLLHFYDRLLPPTTLVSVLLLGLFVMLRRRRDGPDEGRTVTLALLALGLVLNGLIFGGLSAPVDRYQSRLVWLVAFFALVELARLLGPRPAGRAVTG